MLYVCNLKTEKQFFKKLKMILQYLIPIYGLKFFSDLIIDNIYLVFFLLVYHLGICLPALMFGVVWLLF